MYYIKNVSNHLGIETPQGTNSVKQKGPRGLAQARDVV
jgi:hypothetical protein